MPKRRSSKMGLEDEHARPIEPDWTVVVSNQITEITQNTRIIDNQLIMIEQLRKTVNSGMRLMRVSPRWLMRSRRSPNRWTRLAPSFAAP